jgi:RNA polymerase sigma-70 factor, ECF subfamily
MHLSDQELIERSNSGDAAAFEQLIFRYDREVLNIASRYTNSSEDAKDIYQETFIRVYRGLSKFQHKSEFSTWLYRIATNVCLTHQAKKKRYVHVSHEVTEENESQIEFAVSDKKTDAHTTDNEISERIDLALKELSTQQRMVFTLRHYQDYKLKDIAAMMNCAEGTVKKYLFEAIRKMRIQLKDIYE